MLKRRTRKVLSSAAASICILLLTSCTVVRSGDGLRVPDHLQLCKTTYNSRSSSVFVKGDLKVPSIFFVYSAAQKELAEEVGCILYNEYSKQGSKEPLIVSFYVETTGTLMEFLLAEKDEVLAHYTFVVMDQNFMMVSILYYFPFRDTLDSLGKKPDAKGGFILEGGEGLISMENFNSLLKDLSNGKFPKK